jgi:hypothetical protein
VANDQRADLSALEKAAWLRDLMAKADRELRLRQGWPPDDPSFTAIFESAEEDDPHPDPLSEGEGRRSSIAASREREPSPYEASA